MRKASSSVALMRPAEDGDGDGMQHFLAGRTGVDHQRQQCEAGRECRHQHRRHALQTAADDEVAPEGHVLVQGQIDVVADLEDAVARGDAGQRDEADHRGDRQRLAGNHSAATLPIKRQRHAAHDDEARTAER